LSGHSLTRENAAGGGTGTGGTGETVVFGTVGHVTAFEVMAFLIARETSSDGGSGHID